VRLGIGIAIIALRSTDEAPALVCSRLRECMVHHLRYIILSV